MSRIKKKHPLAIRWFHWINFPVLTVMIWSGILIYWANDIYRIGYGSHTFIKLFPDAFYHPGQRLSASGDEIHPALYHLDHRLAAGMAWHFLFMWIFAINGALYVLYTVISGEWRYLIPNRGSVAEAIQVVLHDLKIRKEPLPVRKFNGAQQIAYTSVILMGVGSLITGMGVYKPTQFNWIDSLFGGYMAVRFVHFWLTMGYVAFFMVHIVQVLRAGWNNFRAMVTGYELAPRESTTKDETQ